MPRLTGIGSTLEGVPNAFDAMRGNKVRAATTILGVALAVFVVVAMSAASHGISKSVTRDLASAGPTGFYVYGVPRRPRVACIPDPGCARNDSPPVTLDEAAAIGRLESIEVVTAHVRTSGAVRYGSGVVRGVRIDALTPNWVEIDGGDIYPGRSFTAAEHESAARVVIVDVKLARHLFSTVAAALHRSIEIDHAPFTVIGVYRNTARVFGKPASLPAGDAPKAIVPLETARRILGTNLRTLDLTVKPRATVSQAEALEDVTALLRTHRGPGRDHETNVAVVTSDRLLEVYGGFFDLFFLLMVVLSTVGLVAGGLGVVAILVPAVGERTREIGVRKALGATSRLILWQFLVEATTLTSVGALAGLAAGAVTAVIVDRFTGIPTSVPAGAIVAALIASALTGILFGLLPAARAARLAPIDALRCE